MSGKSVYRQRAKILVSLFPGIHLRELQRSLNISFNTVRHHVDILSKSGEIERLEEGHYSRLYPVGTSAEDKALFSSSRSHTKRLILSALVQTPNLTHGQISDLTGLAKSTVSEQIQALLDSQIAQSTISLGNRVTYSLRDPVSVYRALARSEQNIFNAAADRFIDLWDF